jgi:hypothetical protein
VTVTIKIAKQTASTGVTSDKIPLGATVNIIAKSDESNPVTVLTLLHFVNSKWEAITGLTPTTTKGVNNGMITTIVLQVKVTTGFENRKYMCSAKYQSTVSGQNPITLESMPLTMDVNCKYPWADPGCTGGAHPLPAESALSDSALSESALSESALSESALSKSALSVEECNFQCLSPCF